MDEALRVVIEMNEKVWNRFKGDLQDVTAQEMNWRPLPQANTINLIVRHLRIDAAWHVMSVEQGDQGQAQEATTAQPPESVPLDFERNLTELEELCMRFIGALRRTTLPGLERQTALAYKDSPPGSIPAHFLGFHLATHLAAHGGQIRTLRNLYRKTRGEPARFFPDNPTFPV
jgi:hypothetical protein